MSNSPKVSRSLSTLRERTIAGLREAILDFRFKPGQRLIERELCEALGVSRTSVREALRQLHAEGWITTIPHIGHSVAMVSKDEALEIFEARAGLEGYAMGLFAARATAAQVDELADIVEQLPDVLERTPRDIVDLMDKFYGLMYRGCGNSVVAAMGLRLRGRVRHVRFATASHYTPTWSKEAVERYRYIVQAIRQRDSAAARKATEDQVDHAAAVAMKIFEEE